jgi:hypothetical protein
MEAHSRDGKRKCDQFELRLVEVGPAKRQKLKGEDMVKCPSDTRERWFWRAPGELRDLVFADVSNYYSLSLLALTLPAATRQAEGMFASRRERRTQ